MRYAGILHLLLSIFLLVGCQAATDEVISTSPLPSNTATIPPAVEVNTPINPTFTAPPEPTRTAEPSKVGMCPPLENYPFSELEDSIVNPYLPPPPGVDRPHHGVDLAVLDEITNMAVAGDRVQTIIAGEVKMVILDRFPYGNAVLVETVPQDSIDMDDLLRPVPTAWAEVTPDPALTCPIYEGLILEEEQRSVYILYAHLEETPSVKVGTRIQCGEVIGKIGMSGNALNPHIHIEARIGPSGAGFESMAHYDGSATPMEMGAYCQWRVSGSFQHFDPMSLLQNLPGEPAP